MLRNTNNLGVINTVIITKEGQGMADKSKFDKVRSRSRDAFAEMDREIAKMNKSGELKVTNSKDKAPPKAKAPKAKAPPKAAPPKPQKAEPPRQQQPAAPPKQQPESNIGSKPKQRPVAPPKQQPKRKGASEDAFAEMEGMITAGREKYGPGYRGETQTMTTGRDGKKRVSHTVRTAKEKKKDK
jgi:hypothetical protein